MLSHCCRIGRSHHRWALTGGSMRSIRLLLAFSLLSLSAVQAQAQINGYSVVNDSPQKSIVRSATANQLRPAPLAVDWHNGPLFNTRDLECFAFGGPYDDYITGEYCSYYGDSQAGTPKVGDVYYVRLHVGNVAA